MHSPTASSTPKATRSKRVFKNNSLKTIVLNAQSIKCEDHNNELQCIISEQKPDIIAITETWLKPDIPNSDIIPDYFSVYRKDRPGGERGGGVLIAVITRFFLHGVYKVILTAFWLLIPNLLSVFAYHIKFLNNGMMKKYYYLCKKFLFN